MPDRAAPGEFVRLIWRGETRITPVLLASTVLTWAGCIAAWLGGGHTERFVVPFLLADQAVTTLTFGAPGSHEVVAASEFVVAAVFAWLAFRSDRWWILVASASLTLCVLVFILEQVIPGFGRFEAISARIGLWMVVGVSLFGGVAERWLAGEDAVSRMGPRPARSSA